MTGASGFIGRHLVEHLGARGADGRADPATLRTAQLVEALRGVTRSCTSPASCRRSMMRTTLAANVDATGAVAAPPVMPAFRMIHISSLAAAGPAPANAPRAEDDPAGADQRLRPQQARRANAASRRATASAGPFCVRAWSTAARSRAAAAVPVRRTRGPAAGRPQDAALHLHPRRRSRSRAINAPLNRPVGRRHLFAGHPVAGHHARAARERRRRRRCAGADGTRADGVTHAAAFAGDLASASRASRR